MTADLMFIESDSFAANESSLMGESISYKSQKPQVDESHATFPSNMVYKGTSIPDGHAIFEATAVGDSTEIGKTAREATMQINQATPQGIQLDRLSKLIGVVAFSVAFIAFWILLISDLVSAKLVLSTSH